MSVDYTISASAQAFAMRDALVALFRAAAVPGGALSTVVDVRPSAQFLGDTPALAVQLMNTDSTEFAQRRRKVLIRIDIVAATKSTETPERAANLDDAMMALEDVIDDSKGHGLVPLLNAPENFGLSGLASETLPGRVDYSYQIREGAQQEVWAYAVLRFTATTYTSF